MKRLLAVLLSFALLLSLAACEKDIGGTTEDPSQAAVDFTPIESGADYFRMRTYTDQYTREDIDYLFHEPVRDTDKAYPLIIFLHGLGDEVTKKSLGTARHFVEALIFLENSSDEYSAYTLVPTTPHANEGWWTDSQLEAFKQLILLTIEQYKIDPDRVYISGISMGGMTACQLVSEMPPNTFAAAVPLSGVRDIAAPYKHYNTAFRIYHSKRDAVVSVTQSRYLYQQMLQAGHPNVELIEFPYGDHTSPLKTVFHEQYDEFFPWLFSQSLS